ncbi:beta-lactamase/transpeptidase-like protein, partial [Mycena rosella]
ASASFQILVSAVPVAQILTPDIDEFINNVLSEWNTPGGAGVAVVRMDGQGGWLIETKGYGIATADGTKVPYFLCPSHRLNLPQLFDILATGLLISNQSLEPQISWTTKIGSILPDWQLMDPVASSESTITDLMSHRTGLPSNDYSLSDSDELPSLIKRLRYLKPSASFRDDLQYNNLMYAVLSYLPTALLPDKPPFARYVKEHILDPLQMNSTTYSFTAANATGRMADGFSRSDVNTSANPLGPGIPRILSNVLSGYFWAWGVLSTANDAVRWLQMLLLNGQHPNTNATISRREAPELSVVVYGAAQMQSSYRGHDLPGWFPQPVTRFPNDGFGVAVFTNDDTFGVQFKEIIKFRIVDEVLGLSPVDWDSRYKASVAAGDSDTPAPPKSTAPLPFPLAPWLRRRYQPLPGLPRLSRSANCTSLVANLNSTFPAELAAADLVWAWDKSFVTYVALSHFSGAVFNVTGWIASPTGNVSAPFWASDSGLEGNVAEFVVSAAGVVGFGIRGGIWGAGNRGNADPMEGALQGATVEEKSEVWYDAVENSRD